MDKIVFSQIMSSNKILFVNAGLLQYGRRKRPYVIALVTPLRYFEFNRLLKTVALKEINHNKIIGEYRPVIKAFCNMLIYDIKSHIVVGFELIIQLTSISCDANKARLCKFIRVIKPEILRQIIMRSMLMPRYKSKRRSKKSKLLISHYFTIKTKFFRP